MKLTEREKGIIHSMCYYILDGLTSKTFRAFDRRTGRIINGKSEELFKIIEKMETKDEVKKK